MRSDRPCPRCGDPIERDEPLVRVGDDASGAVRERADRLCDACYLDAFDLVDAPDRLSVTACGGCGAVLRGDSWRDVGARGHTDVAVDAVREALGVHVAADEVSWGVEPEQVDETTIRMHCLFTGTVRGLEVEEAVTVPVTIGRGTCDRCGRAAGGYHEAVVQARAAGRDLTAAERETVVDIARSYVAEREAAGDRNAFVADVTEREGGVDVQISASQMGQGIATRVTDELGGTCEHHPTLVTEDEDGDEVYRVTYAVRLPRFVPGDVVDPGDGDGPVLVTGVDERVTGVRLASGERYESPREAGIDPPGRAVGTRADAVETTVVAVEDEHAVQVLDPETYETVSVPRSGAVDADTEAVPVIRSDGDLYLLPDEE